MTWPHSVDRTQLDITCARGTGKGGQKRNKTSTKVRIVHLPTGIAVECDETRSQHQNKRLAFRKLAELLVPIMKNEAQKARYAAGTERVRTYHEPDDRVTDDRCGGSWPYRDVLEGHGLADVIEAVVTAEAKK